MVHTLQVGFDGASTLSIAPLIITPFSIMKLIITTRIMKLNAEYCLTECRLCCVAFIIVMLIVVMLNAVLLSVVVPASYYLESVSYVMCAIGHGILIEGEGSVQLTSLYLLA